MSGWAPFLRATPVRPAAPPLCARAGSNEITRSPAGDAGGAPGGRGGTDRTQGRAHPSWRVNMLTRLFLCPLPRLGWKALSPPARAAAPRGGRPLPLPRRAPTRTPDRAVGAVFAMSTSIAPPAAGAGAGVGAASIVAALSAAACGVGGEGGARRRPGGRHPPARATQPTPPHPPAPAWPRLRPAPFAWPPPPPPPACARCRSRPRAPWRAEFGEWEGAGRGWAGTLARAGGGGADGTPRSFPAWTGGAMAAQPARRTAARRAAAPGRRGTNTQPAELTASGLGQPAWRWSAGTWPSSRAAATARAGCVGAGTGKQGGPPASPGPAAVLTAPPAQPQHPPTRIHPQSTPPHLSAERRPREPAARPPSGRCSADLGSHARRRPQGVAQAGQGGLGGGMGCLGC